MTRRRPLLLTALAVVVLVGVALLVVLPRKQAADTARTVAREYVDLVAHGTSDDLERLWAMTASEETGGALRTAGTLLVDAEERIEVVSVGGPRTIQRPGDLPDLSPWADVDRYVAVDVRYRLDGAEHGSRLVLVRQAGTGGRDVDDWRVARGLLGSIDWERAGPLSFPSDPHVSGARIVRRQLSLGGDEDVQPLYPARYRVQRRTDPWFTSAEETLAVPAGEAVAPPELTMVPTQATVDRIRESVLKRIRSCGDPDDVLGWCPLEDLAEAHGARPWDYRSWWGGLARKPQVELDGGLVTVTGGVVRIRGSQGVEEVPFGGTGSAVLGTQQWEPALVELEIEETP